MSPPPNPNSIPSRALAHLETLGPGVELVNARLAEAIGANPSSLHSVMALHVKNGRVLRRQKGGHPRSPIFWSLPPDDDGQPVQRIVPAASAPPLGVKPPPWPPLASVSIAAPQQWPPLASVSIAAPQQWPTPTYDGTLPEAKPINDIVLAPTSATADPLHLRAALWSDGSLELRRGSKQVALLLPEETRDLVHYLVSTRAGA